MITGVTKGYEYKMRLVYAHFPININIESELEGGGERALVESLARMAGVRKWCRGMN